MCIKSALKTFTMHQAYNSFENAQILWSILSQFWDNIDFSLYVYGIYMIKIIQSDAVDACRWATDLQIWRWRSKMIRNKLDLCLDLASVMAP